MSFKASYPGRCGNCGEEFDPGSEVVYVDKVLLLIHNPCIPVGDRALEEIGHKPQGVCRRCFTVHVGECL